MSPSIRAAPIIRPAASLMRTALTTWSATAAWVLSSTKSLWKTARLTTQRPCGSTDTVWTTGSGFWPPWRTRRRSGRGTSPSMTRSASGASPPPTSLTRTSTRLTTTPSTSSTRRRPWRREKAFPSRRSWAMSISSRTTPLSSTTTSGPASTACWS